MVGIPTLQSEETECSSFSCVLSSHSLGFPRHRAGNLEFQSSGCSRNIKISSPMCRCGLALILHGSAALGMQGSDESCPLHTHLLPGVCLPPDSPGSPKGSLQTWQAKIPQKKKKKKREAAEGRSRALCFPNSSEKSWKEITHPICAFLSRKEGFNLHKLKHKLDK